VLTTSKIPFTAVAFREGWGNDEMVFDSPIVGIPSVSVDRAPFANYHLSSDDVSKFNLDKANQIIELVFRLLSLIERDYIPEPQFTVPPQLSRFGLYQDWTINREGYKSVMTLLDSLDGKTSVLDIALRNKIEVEFTFDFFEKLKLENLIVEHPLNAQYARRSF
jgi:aminopeptidase-like protein